MRRVARCSSVYLFCIMYSTWAAWPVGVAPRQASTVKRQPSSHFTGHSAHLSAHISLGPKAQGAQWKVNLQLQLHAFARDLRPSRSMHGRRGLLAFGKRANKHLVATTVAALLFPKKRRYATAATTPTVCGCHTFSLNFLAVTVRESAREATLRQPSRDSPHAQMPSDTPNPVLVDRLKSGQGHEAAVPFFDDKGALEASTSVARDCAHAECRKWCLLLCTSGALSTPRHLRIHPQSGSRAPQRISSPTARAHSLCSARR